MATLPADPPAENNHIFSRVIEEEMKTAYINYAMSVIVGRALPDVRDGLKPVHRRILYSMYEMGLMSNKPFKKCARIVGDCLGKYHPHGDTAVYDSLVRMAQDFSLRYPLIRGQGNFGSIDGDSAAAMRYTEAKLQKLAEEILIDIDKNTVDFKDNFDGSLKEPEVLPSLVPNLLVNGSSGIAVGMATNLPPHNLSEVCNAIIATIDNPEINTEELIKIIPGPDFPTGGEVGCGSPLISAYVNGRGKVTIMSVCKIISDKIIVTEIPYQVNKEELIKQIADLVKDKTVDGIKNINDESDREGIRIVIELKKETDPQVILNQLYKFSRLKVSFGIIMLALVNSQPQILSLKQIIEAHIDHRKTVIVRRTKYELEQAQKRVQVLEGLLVALANLDQVIPGIRNSRTVEDAARFLMQNYSLSETQVKAILELRLQKLASLEQEKIKMEHTELLERINYYLEILGSVAKVLSLIKEELSELKLSYGDVRRSTIVPNDDDEEVDMEELIEEATMAVTITNSGYIKRIPLDTYKTQSRGGKGVKAAGINEEDFVKSLYITSTHDYLLFFTDRGQVYWKKVYSLPEGSRQAKGKHVSNVLELEEGEQISAVIPVLNFKEGNLFMATKRGTVKKTSLLEFSHPRKGGIRAITLENQDTLVSVKYTSGNEEIILATKNGYANRFNEQMVRTMGRTAGGVRGIRLTKEDEVIGMITAEQTKQVLTLTENGYGKRTSVEDYRLCNRGGRGVTNIKITEKNGPVKAIKLVNGSEGLMLVTEKGIAIRVRCSEISLIGRATQGVRVIRLSPGDKLAAAAIVVDEEVPLELTRGSFSPTDGSNFDEPNSVTNLNLPSSEQSQPSSGSESEKVVDEHLEKIQSDDKLSPGV